MIRKGSQFYLEIEFDEELDFSSIQEVQFFIGDLLKENEDIQIENNKFKIWLTESETNDFDENILIQAKILFKNNIVVVSDIEYVKVLDVLQKTIIGGE